MSQKTSRDSLGVSPKSTREVFFAVDDGADLPRPRGPVFARRAGDKANPGGQPVRVCRIKVIDVFGIRKLRPEIGLARFPKELAEQLLGLDSSFLSDDN